jgi:hypothetical protein
MELDFLLLIYVGSLALSSHPAYCTAQWHVVGLSLGFGGRVLQGWSLIEGRGRREIVQNDWTFSDTVKKKHSRNLLHYTVVPRDTSCKCAERSLVFGTLQQSGTKQSLSSSLGTFTDYKNHRWSVISAKRAQFFYVLLSRSSHLLFRGVWYPTELC